MNKNDDFDPNESAFDRLMRRMNAPDRPIKIVRLDPYETAKTKDVVRLSREGFCTVACKMLFAKLGNGELWGLMNNERDSVSHYFLLVDGKAVDFGGFMSLEEMQLIFGEYHRAIPVEWERLHYDIRELGLEPEERSIVVERFREHLDSTF